VTSNYLSQQRHSQIQKITPILSSDTFLKKSEAKDLRGRRSFTSTSDWSTCSFNSPIHWQPLGGKVFLFPSSSLTYLLTQNKTKISRITILTEEEACNLISDHILSSASRGNSKKGRGRRILDL